MFWKLLTYVWKLISIHELSKYFDKERWSKYESVLQTTIWEADDEQKWKHTLTYRGHERVKNTDSEGSATCEWLSEIEFSVRIIIIILIKKLNIAVIAKHGDHRHSWTIQWSHDLWFSSSISKITQNITRIRGCNEEYDESVL